MMGLGYGLGATYEDVEKSLLGSKVTFDEFTPDVLRLFCILDVINDLEPTSIDEGDMQRAVVEVQHFLTATGSESSGPIRQDLRDTLMDKCGVFRSDALLRECLADIKELQQRFQNVSIDDKSKQFNTDLLDAVELGHMLDFAEVIVVGAIARQESRGGHARKDFPTRDDEHWHKHTIAYRADGGPRLEYTAVNMQPMYRDPYPLEERKY